MLDWLGEETFEQLFSPHYRDTMTVTLFANDLADMRGEKYPYNQHSLRHLCNQTGVHNEKPHDALYDCLATAEVYRCAMQQFISAPVCS